MQQSDMFNETLQKKIFRMEKWIGRLQREVWFLKEVYILTKKSEKVPCILTIEAQEDMFGT